MSNSDTFGYPEYLLLKLEQKMNINIFNRLVRDSKPPITYLDFNGNSVFPTIDDYYSIYESYKQLGPSDIDSRGPKLINLYKLYKTSVLIIDSLEEKLHLTQRDNLSVQKSHQA